MRLFVETVAFTALLCVCAVVLAVVSPVLTEWHPVTAGAYFAGLAASIAYAVLSVSRAQARIAARRAVRS